MPRKPIARETLEPDKTSTARRSLARSLASDTKPRDDKGPRHQKKTIDYSKLRPNSKLTPDLIASIHRQLVRGISIGSILGSSLILHDTFGRWCRYGETYLADGGPKEHAIYGSLVLAIQQGLGKRNRRFEKEVSDPGNPNHRQFLNIVERLIPEVWDPKTATGATETANPDDRFL